MRPPNVTRLGHRKMKKLMEQGMIPPQAMGQPGGRFNRYAYGDDDLLAGIEVDRGRGASFRCCFYFIVILFVAFLFYLKWYVDMDMGPDVQAGEKSKASEEAKLKEDELMAEFNIDRDDNEWKTKLNEAIRKRAEELETKSSADCPECAQQLVALKQDHYAVASVVTTPLEEVLSVDRRAGTAELRKQFEKKKKEAEEGKGKFALAELQEAYDIMSHPQARQYYNLYGEKAPEFIKHRRDAKHGGWGTEMLVGTFKYIVLNAWLDHFDSWKVEVGFFVFIFIVLGYKVWTSSEEFMEKVKQIEESEEMQRELREKDKEDAAKAAVAAKLAAEKKEAKMERKLAKLHKRG